MGKKHYAKLTRLRCYCSKCDRTYLYTADEVEFDGWESPGECINHGGVDMEFTCKGCDKRYLITLNEY